MKYTKEQRLDIGRQIVDGELTVTEAMDKYQVSKSCAQSYATTYKRANGIPVHKTCPSISERKPVICDADLEKYQEMSKEELIRELILSKANELRAKKGYEVKGDGQKKEFIILNNENSK